MLGIRDPELGTWPSRTAGSGVEGLVRVVKGSCNSWVANSMQSREKLGDMNASNNLWSSSVRALQMYISSKIQEMWSVATRTAKAMGRCSPKYLAAVRAYNSCMSSRLAELKCWLSLQDFQRFMSWSPVHHDSTH